MDNAGGPIVIEPKSEGRFARFEAIKWWDQTRLREAKVLVIGAGALGNEAIKNLALLGVGNLLIVDMDRVEESNLSRSVLFRAEDEGQSKAAAAARRAVEIYPEMCAVACHANVLSGVGLGYFRWADMVVGALDNREARLFVNRACAQVGRTWIDGGIDVLNGIVRGFAPPATACYECTMGEADWELIAKRRSCSLLARRAMQEGGVPTTPTTASVVGAIQAQEVVKALHGLNVLQGRAYVFEGLMHNSFTVNYPISPDCPWHEKPSDVEERLEFDRLTPLRQIWNLLASRLGGLDALDLSREVVETLECPTCKTARPVMKCAELIDEDEARCANCNGECVPRYFHSISAGSPLLEMSASQLGLPRWDIIWGRAGEQMLGIELSGDRAAVLSGNESVQH